MTELLNRARPASRPPGRPPTPSGRAVTVTAAIAAATVAVGGLLVAVALALAGWVAAGSPGSAAGALRTGTQGWLLGHGTPLVLDGVAWTLVPLGLTGLLGVAIVLTARWLARVTPDADLRESAVGGAVLVATYLVVAMMAAVLSATDGAEADLVGTLVRVLPLVAVLAAVGLLLGGAAGDRLVLPDWAGPVARLAGRVLGLLLAVATALVLVRLLLRVDEVGAVSGSLGLGGGDVVALVLLSALALPNAALYAVAWLLGPGFVVGTGTLVAPTQVDLGPVPAFPLLAALPQQPLSDWWATVALAVPPLCAAAAAVLAARRDPQSSWRQAAVRGGGGGVLAGALVGLFTALASGAAGDGRLADVGAAAWPVGGMAVLSLGLGALAGSLGHCALHRRATASAAAAVTTPDGDA